MTGNWLIRPIEIPSLASETQILDTVKRSIQIYLHLVIIILDFERQVIKLNQNLAMNFNFNFLMFSSENKALN